MTYELTEAEMYQILTREEIAKRIENIKAGNRGYSGEPDNFLAQIIIMQDVVDQGGDATDIANVMVDSYYWHREIAEATASQFIASIS